MYYKRYKQCDKCRISKVCVTFFDNCHQTKLCDGKCQKCEDRCENSISSKKEIEDTIDTLNVAFEKLLDSLFQDTAWDVSSDISVLHTMLAQEGLTEDGLKK